MSKIKALAIVVVVLLGIFIIINLSINTGLEIDIRINDDEISEFDIKTFESRLLTTASNLTNYTEGEKKLYYYIYANDTLIKSNTINNIGEGRIQVKEKDIDFNHETYRIEIFLYKYGVSLDGIGVNKTIDS